ncbi:hypothetical protein [Patulibacter minatonensis]|uniref:hypothetical protein n=1 Tax=Patulibacter minatonensis TaxID=298163 RepID=UPI00047D5727|nr:hypothetical protein [Patulibacter minatonensis]
MNEFDRLEQQLRTSTRRLDPDGAPGRPPWWRRPLGLTAIALPVTVVAGVAGASAIIDRSDANKRADVVVRRVVDATSRAPACERALPRGTPSHRFSASRPRPELLRILPTLARPTSDRVPSAAMRNAWITAGDAAILRGSLRWSVFPDGTRVLLFVTEGGLHLKDADACRAARLERLGDLPDLDAAVRDRAEEVLRTRPDTDPKAQVYWSQHNGGASGSPVQPGHPISTRRDFSYGDGFRGIAHPRAVSVRVQRVRPGPHPRVWRGEGAFRARVPVVSGIYAFKGRGGTSGRFRIVQYDRAGTVVRRVVLP